jgi:hypothetical protein
VTPVNGAGPRLTQHGRDTTKFARAASAKEPWKGAPPFRMACTWASAVAATGLGEWCRSGLGDSAERSTPIGTSPSTSRARYEPN